ncbi:MAG TPA: DGQHR domain-containing protein [Candidatus Acidoferrales bacterium]|jgi:DGQHR domain-containing protein|nr:DGQHR domain-containing protein [Candidatus Acidoferrales bacterium]
MKKKPKEERISVIVPKNPFVPADLQEKNLCLCALDVTKLMEWWPGTPHSPHRDAEKVKAIQRSLEWKRVAQIAAYLLQREIEDVPVKLNKYFREIYEPRKNEPGREWPPNVKGVITPIKSGFPTFSNVLLHVNGAKIEPAEEEGAGTLTFDAESASLSFQVIDGQHRINGAYFAVRILQEDKPQEVWQIPAEVFLDLDPPGKPQRQAQIFIDVNFNQKKVDRSLVADLYPTAREHREALDDKERAQDIGRRLMLETGPLVGMIQIPGIRYGVKDVITLATLNNAIEDVLPTLARCGIAGLEMQTDFLAQCLTAWLEASGRFHGKGSPKKMELDPGNVAYQGRVLVSILALAPAMLRKLKNEGVAFVSTKAQERLTRWLQEIADRASLLHDGVFIDKKEFKNRKYLGSGGIGLFRDTLWAATTTTRDLRRVKPEKVAQIAKGIRAKTFKSLGI